MASVPLHEFIALNREEIIRRCRAKVASRSMPPPTEQEINQGVPLFLDQMVDALRLGLRSSPEIGRSAVLHGQELRLQGFKRGSVGVNGSTGAVLLRTLGSMRALMEQSIAEVRLPQAVMNRQQFMVSEFIDDLSAALEAQIKGLTLNVMPVEGGVMIDADRGVLAAVVGNLLKNAFKFTSPRTTVTLRVGASVERVLIEILDECRGLPDGTVSERFRRFEELPADGAMGLGLAFSRWGVEANDGKIYARNLPGRGCVFTVDLPRLTVPAVVTVES